MKIPHLVLLGYGLQGKAEATNLKKSKIPFTVACRKSGDSFQRALSDGHEVKDIEEALDMAETVAINLPDHLQKDVYEKNIRHRKNIKRLIFAHGFNTHYKLIPVVEDGPTHLLVAPKGAASGLVEFYGTPQSLPGILAFETKRSDFNEALEKSIAEAYALGVGCHPKGLIWARFKDETECDLFSEQALLCGGVSQLLRYSYETLVEGGYHPEAAYFETLFELKLIVDLMAREGISGMRKKISPTARYGDLTRGDRVITPEVKLQMKKVLSEVQSGDFAKEFLASHESPNYLAKIKEQEAHSIEIMGAKLRDRLKNLS